MCLIAWRSDPGSAWPLVLAANRDEQHDRACLGVHRWTPEELAGCERPRTHHLVAGRDLRAGGTWLGLIANGTRLRVAALTNRRDGRAPPPQPASPSRGRLVLDALIDESAALATLGRLATDGVGPGAVGGIGSMAGFNLVVVDLDFDSGRRSLEGPVVDGACLAHPGPSLSGAGTAAPAALPGGVHGISNGAVDEPWPKTRRLMRAIDAAVVRLAAHEPAATGRGGRGTARATDGRIEAMEEELFDVLADRRRADDAELPDTGIGIERERWLSPAFIVGETYGTRCSTIIAVSADGHYRVHERRFDASGRTIAAAVEVGSTVRRPR